VTVDVVLIGTGVIAREHLAALSDVPDVTVAAVCDLSPAAAEATAERFHVRRWFTDHRAMLETIAPEMVHVTTPVTSHYALVRDALQAGASVIVEKPIAVHYHECVALIAQARETGRFVVEGYSHLFDEPIERLLAMVDGGDMGAVVHADIGFRQRIFASGSPFLDPHVPHPAAALPGGAIGDFLPHLASLAQRLVGAHRQVQTNWHRSRADTQPDEFRALIDGEYASATLSFSARASPQGVDVRVTGTKLSAAAGIAPRALVVERERSWRRPWDASKTTLEAGAEVVRAGFRAPWDRLAGRPPYLNVRRMVAATYAALAEGRPPPISMRQIDEVNRLRRDLVAGIGRT
jgi:predicted dehydrogenase